ncbi:conserved hypothetical protein [Leishmania braziliensis MHOM/BR/75/M2904]|uniref:Uncharacterized protein n=2 Tax=Leishmania braziliensis TaxID=5660 RepID=A4H4S7_LEIBR|nr:conserved hypothetical protein [Leishmania braziliensis MHOM/BR/75/M2904]CAJ2466714.1 unnamed protein product [Leishmania braziliensis]CAM37072.2 conserved hypothetical protein [Leishmania braziliensis MHOM/BR/75/M2904]SYZ62947.1 hypothetical_protein [Leishmania braziliensis MHOM/BR/75/M2904]
MNVDVAYAELVPRYVDLALFLCGEALRRIKDELRQHATAAAPLYAWHLRKVCFLHVLPNDGDAGVDDAATDNSTAAAAAARRVGGTGPSCAAAPPDPIDEEASWGVAPVLSAQSSKEVSFRRAYAQLHRPCGVDSWTVVSEKSDTHVTPAATDTSLRSGGGTSQAAEQVHPCPPPGVGHRWDRAEVPPPPPARVSAAPTDAGFGLLCDFLRTAAQAGGTPLMQRLAAVLCGVVAEGKGITSAPEGHPSGIEVLPSAPTITVAHLSDLFDEDLFDDELSAEAGNATRSFHIWVNYEWASASFARQTQLAAAVTTWLAALRHCFDGLPSRWLAALKQRAAASAPPLPPLVSTVPINVRRMHAALEGVFEGHPSARAMLMELSLTQSTPHLTDNALLKLLFLQGPPASMMMVRAELSNRGTQTILMCITSGMLLYAQYYLSFRSLAVARQCARVALQVAQEVQSNAILALAHYTAHVVAIHQGRPVDAANSISIALQLTLSNGSGSSSGQRAGPADGTLSSVAPTLSGTDAQLASLAFAGAAQLLLFFPGAVGPALRSLLSTGRQSSSGGFGDGDAEAQHTRSAEGGGSEDPNDFTGRHNGAVAVQTIAQSIRHSLLRANAALLQAPPVEGRWIGIVASLQRETLLLIGAMYGMVSSPLVITTASLRQLLEEVKEETSTASPVYSHHPRRALLWEVLRHAAHHALALQEGFLAPSKCTASSASGGATMSDALRCLHSALTAVGDHYGASASAAANEAVFFSSVVRYCSGCQLYTNGYVAAAYDVWSRLAETLNPAPSAGDMEGGHSKQRCATHSPADADAVTSTNSLHDEDAEHFWPPDHLLLYALVQRRRAQAAVFLGHIVVPHRLQKELLTVSSRYAFPFGVLTAQLMEAQAHQQHGRFSVSLNVARHVEQAATRIGYPSLCEAARTLQVTAYAHSGCWCEAQRTLAKCCPTTASQRTSVLLQQYTAYLEPLLLHHMPGSAGKVECLTRSWIALLMREGLVAAKPVHDDGDLCVRATAAGISAVDELCLYSSLQRACALLGYRTNVIEKRTVNCLETLSARQHCPTPGLCIHGSCEELCRSALYGDASCDAKEER